MLRELCLIPTLMELRLGMDWKDEEQLKNVNFGQQRVDLSTGSSLEAQPRAT